MRGSAADRGGDVRRRSGSRPTGGGGRARDGTIALVAPTSPSSRSSWRRSTSPARGRPAFGLTIAFAQEERPRSAPTAPLVSRGTSRGLAQPGAAAPPAKGPPSRDDRFRRDASTRPTTARSLLLVQTSSRRPAARPALGGFRSACVSSHAGDTRRRCWSGRNPLLPRTDPSTVPLRHRAAVGFEPCACRRIAGTQARALPLRRQCGRGDPGFRIGRGPSVRAQCCLLEEQELALDAPVLRSREDARITHRSGRRAFGA